jgi:hypothetical protein
LRSNKKKRKRKEKEKKRINIEDLTEERKNCAGSRSPGAIDQLSSHGHALAAASSSSAYFLTEIVRVRDNRGLGQAPKKRQLAPR